MILLDQEPDGSPETGSLRRPSVHTSTPCQQAVKDGDMVVIDENDRLWSSGELDPNDARKTREEKLEWPVVTSERNGHHDPGDPSAHPEY